MHQTHGREPEELVVQSNVYWLGAKFLVGKANSRLVRNMDSVHMRAAESQPLAMQQVSVPCSSRTHQEELMQAEAYDPKDQSPTAERKPVRSCAG